MEIYINNETLTVIFITAARVLLSIKINKSIKQIKSSGCVMCFYTEQLLVINWDLINLVRQKSFVK